MFRFICAGLPFQSAPNLTGTHYRQWKLIAAWNLYIPGLILRIVLMMIYNIIWGTLVLINLILNLFGIRWDLVAVHSVLSHILTGKAIPKHVNDEYKDIFRMHRSSWLHTWPLFWYF